MLILLRETTVQMAARLLPKKYVAMIRRLPGRVIPLRSADSCRALGDTIRNDKKLNKVVIKQIPDSRKNKLRRVFLFISRFQPVPEGWGSLGSPLCYSSGGIPRCFQKLHPRDVKTSTSA